MTIEITQVTPKVVDATIIMVVDGVEEKSEQHTNAFTVTMMVTNGNEPYELVVDIAEDTIQIMVETAARTAYASQQVDDTYECMDKVKLLKEQYSEWPINQQITIL